MPTAAMVSFRLGGTDGVSVDAAAWSWALGRLGWRVRQVAGSGSVDVVVAGLGIDLDGGPQPGPPSTREVTAALEGCSLVVVENLLSLPLNPPAAAAVADVLARRPTLVRHHDLPWQRQWSASLPPPADDPAWLHVTSMEWSRRQLADRGIEAAALGVAVDTEGPPGDRDGTRSALGVRAGERLVLQPTRAIERKNVPAGVAVAEALGATYWLTGPAEEGYGPTLESVLGHASCRVLRGLPATVTMADAYAACDVVTFPSLVEGFGIPVLEAAVAHRPCMVGANEAAAELADLGFVLFDASDTGALADLLERPDPAGLARNAALAELHFARRDLPGRLAGLLKRRYPDLLDPTVGQFSNSSGGGGFGPSPS